MREWILSEINYGYVKNHPYDLAVLPMGATEPHNLHLPYGTDTFESLEIASRSCEAAFRRGARVVMLPGIIVPIDATWRSFLGTVMWNTSPPIVPW